MKKIKVEVVGGKRSRKETGKGSSLAVLPQKLWRGMLMRPRLMLAGAATAFVLFVGTPHAAWDYGCRHQMSGIGTCEAASWCEYYGVQGRQVYRPTEWETCKFVRFLPINWRQVRDGLSDMTGGNEPQPLPQLGDPPEPERRLCFRPAEC